MTLTIPPEGAYSDTELRLIALEPERLLPQSQDSFWGQQRVIFGAYIDDMIVSTIDDWWKNLDPANAVDPMLARWERLVGLPPSADKSILLRRAFVLVRLIRGPFTRVMRNRIIELFITATFGAAIEFVPEGVPFDSGGVPFYSGVYDLAGTYTVVEDITDFSFAVTILDTIDVDIDGLTRELSRISPYPFTVASEPTLPE